MYCCLALIYFGHKIWSLEKYIKSVMKTICHEEVVKKNCYIALLSQFLLHEIITHFLDNKFQQGCSTIYCGYIVQYNIIYCN